MIGNKARILGVAVDSSSKEEVLNRIVNLSFGDERKGELWDVSCGPCLPAGRSGVRSEGGETNEAKKRSIIVFTPNPEFLVEASKDCSFRELLNKADINLPDGIGLVWAGRLLSEPIKERISGADVVESILQTANSKQQIADGNKLLAISGKPAISSKLKRWTIGIAGARRGVQSEADELVKRLQEKYPNIKFVNLDREYVIAKPTLRFGGEVEAIPIELQYSHGIASSHAPRNDMFQIVLACHGMKKQEQWIIENKDKFKANVFMGVGGSLDFITGFTKRAPLLMRQMGMEWLWRGVQKPKHFLRIWRAVFVFSRLLLKEIIKNR